MNIASQLNKRFNSLRNARARGRRVLGCIEQVTAYEALREHVQKEDPVLWQKFCKANKVDAKHTAYHILQGD